MIVESDVEVDVDVNVYFIIAVVEVQVDVDVGCTLGRRVSILLVMEEEVCHQHMRAYGLLLQVMTTSRCRRTVNSMGIGRSQPGAQAAERQALTAVAAE